MRAVARTSPFGSAAGSTIRASVSALHAELAARDALALGDGLRADVDHARAALAVEVRETLAAPLTPTPPAAALRALVVRRVRTTNASTSREDLLLLGLVEDLVAQPGVGAERAARHAEPAVEGAAALDRADRVVVAVEHEHRHLDLDGARGDARDRRQDLGRRATPSCVRSTSGSST